MKVSLPSRLSVLFFVFSFLSLLLAGRLYFLQIVHGEEFSERADRQYIRPVSTSFNRGSIFFENRDGTHPGAATLKSGFTVAINPNLLPDPQKVYERLSSTLTLDSENFFARAGKKDDPYEEIARRVDEATAERINALGITGLSTFHEKWRFYPRATLAAHAIGFVAYKGDTLSGQYGLERYYDDVLRRDGGDIYINFFAEIFSGIKKNIVEKKPGEGDIVTTIEPSVQTFLEDKLREIDTQWSPEEIGGIIINPQNGEIYAMAGYPTFDPNNFQGEKDISLFRNPLIENVYEMGSIIKPLTIAVAIDAGVITATTTYEDRGFLVLNNAKISNYDGKARGVVDMQEVLNQSLNTGAAFAALRMGKETFTKYMKNFHLGDETGIDLPNESYGLTKNFNNPRDVELATAAYGQGVAFTPIATVRALSALGNGGTLIDPHIVKKIEYRTGLSKTITSLPGERVIKKSTSDEITRMLVNVVDKALLGGVVKLPHYSIAAKTGTAQIAKSGGGGYDETRFLHSFFGYFPAYKPQFLVFLFAINPLGARYASETLTRPFMDTTKFLINYYEIPPDR
ncbi:MAG: penicillin-binding protein 2 [Patescibacteria group bacterium]